MRSKIKTTLFFAFLMIFVSQAFAQKRIGGLALYTVRQEMGEDPIKTLQAVADAGYKYVEAAGYKDGKFYGMEPKVFKETLKNMGLEPMSTHMNMVTMENADQLIAESKEAGFKFFVIPVPPMGLFKFDRETRSRSIDDIKAVSDILHPW